MYIEGLGYITDTTYNTYSVLDATQTASSANTQVIGQSTFDKLLKQETANLANQGRTVDLESIFKEASEKYNIDINLLKAVAMAESNFNPDATSHCGAMGIMQLMPSTAQSLGVTDAYDPYQNIMGGAKLLSQLKSLYNGDIKLMLAGYNAGPGNVEKYNGIPPFEETQSYVVKVMQYLGQDINIDGKTVTINTGRESVAPDKKDSIYNQADLDKIFSYTQYQLLMQYFDTMLDIISSIGDSDGSSSSNSGDDSLADLFRLGGSQISYNNSILNLL